MKSADIYLAVVAVITMAIVAFYAGRKLFRADAAASAAAAAGDAPAWSAAAGAAMPMSATMTAAVAAAQHRISDAFGALIAELRTQAARFTKDTIEYNQFARMIPLMDRIRGLYPNVNTPAEFGATDFVSSPSAPTGRAGIVSALATMLTNIQGQAARTASLKLYPGRVPHSIVEMRVGIQKLGPFFKECIEAIKAFDLIFVSYIQAFEAGQ